MTEFQDADQLIADWRDGWQERATRIPPAELAGLVRRIKSVFDALAAEKSAREKAEKELHDMRASNALWHCKVIKLRKELEDARNVIDGKKGN